jgi:putative membrane protein
MGSWMVVWWVAGIIVLVLLVRLVAGSTSGFSRRDDETPEQILKRRYAKGEINSEEYQHRLADLRR